MRKSVWVAVTLAATLAATLAGCASTGVYESETAKKETFSVDTNYQAAFRRAGEYVRTCHTQVSHPYGVSYAWRHTLGEKGAPDEIKLYKVGQPATVLELISAEADGPATSKVTVTVLGEGRWDEAEIAAARKSIQSATPICRSATGG
ncbi:BPTD_2524 family lipoprotein [Achromobacter spanius]|uniref:BPTD_2524 family lipoprotein n=1 Tax=Achromobacter spanius TaxID=217203 RepID=UPI003826D3D1